MRRRIKNSNNLVLYIGLGIILVTILAGIYFFRFGHRGMNFREPDYLLSANQLYTEYVMNETQAKQKYLGRVLEIEGLVSGTGLGSTGKAYVTLQTDGGKGHILCILSPVPSGDPPRVDIGERIKIRGINSGKLLSVILEDCSVIRES